MFRKCLHKKTKIQKLDLKFVEFQITNSVIYYEDMANHAYIYNPK